MSSQQIVFIVGPTAVGKSGVAYQVAKRINGEIISCDSMQVYQQLHIITNKPSREMLATIPHHLVGIIPLAEEFDVARFNTLALEAIAAIHGRHRIPVVAGGSGLYMQILLDGIFPEAPKNDRVRHDLKDELERRGLEYLYKRLQEVDPPAALKIHPHDSRRIIRALEVYQTRREPISVLHQKRQGLWGRCDITMIGLTMERQGLYRRIDQRVEDMFAAGAVAEVKSVSGVPLSLTAGRLIGLREIRGYLEGAYGEDRARELMKLNTRRFAKRQLTWFRKEKRLRWITIRENDTVEDIVDEVMSLVEEDREKYGNLAPRE